MSVERYPAKANLNWSFDAPESGSVSWDACHAILLMDIREELRTLNRLLGCSRFTGIPADLRAIRRNTARRKQRTRKPPTVGRAR